MYTAHLASALAMERQRALSEEAARAHALRQAREVRRRHRPAGPRSRVVAEWVAALRLRAAQTEYFESEASGFPETAPCSPPVR